MGKLPMARTGETPVPPCSGMVSYHLRSTKFAPKIQNKTLPDKRQGATYLNLNGSTTVVGVGLLTRQRQAQQLLPAREPA